MQATTDKRQFWTRTGVLAVVGAIVAVALGAAFMSIGHNPKPHDVPIAVVGAEAAAKQIEAEAPGKLVVRAVPDAAAARDAIRDRDVYAAVVPGPKGASEVMIAPAASNQVANFMRRTFGAATADNVPKVVDVAPLPEDDSNGLSIGLLLQVLIIGGSIGVIGIAQLLPHFEGDPRRGIVPLAFLVGYALLFGVLLTVTAAAFGVGADASFGDRVLVFSLISLAVTASTGAFVALLGPAGAGVSSVLYFILGAQISGAGTAPEFLPAFWHDLGQALPAGAGTSLLRDVFYFPDAATGEPVAILAAYAVAGLAVVIVLSAIRRRRSVPAAVAGRVELAGAGA